MPIYEYRCNQCNRKSSHFFRSFSAVGEATCPRCQSGDMKRLMSSFQVHTPWYSGLNIPSSESLGDFDEDDPKSMARWVKGMRRDMGNSFGREVDDFVSEMDAYSRSQETGGASEVADE